MSALFPIADLADLICASTASHQVIAVMRGYFDDSGTHQGSPVIACAGVVSPCAEWTAIESAWRAKLAQYDLIDFSASKCAANDPPYDRLRATEREALVMELARLIADFKLMPISAAVHLDAWSDPHIRALSKAPAFFQRYPRPFLLCFDHCVQVASNWMRHFAPSETIALVFNEQATDAEDAKKVFEAYKATKRWGIYLETLTFAPSRGRPPLQVVDLLANEIFHYWLSLAQGVDTLAYRPALRIMWSRDSFSLARFYGIGGLAEAMRKYVP